MRTKFNGIMTLLLVLFVQISFAQDKTISGTVSDESGPLPGVTIIIKGTTRGTETDFDGNYSVKAKSGEVLIFSFIGMKTTEAKVGASNTINLVMENDNLLDEIVVTAYGTQTKESLTGSVTQIDSQEFTKVASGNAVTGLTGKVAGVQIFSGSGQPGAAPTIRFRGIGSLNGSSDPLFVVDGIPFTESITTINPNDIESMSFVKDASAAALYGNRGANGVVIITTKKGKSGGIKINLDIKTSITGLATKDYNVIKGSSEYLEAYHRMLKTNGMVNDNLSELDAGQKATTDLMDGTLGLVYNPFGGDRNTLVDPTTGKFRGGNTLWQDDWRDYLFEKTSGIQSYYLSASGGSDNTTYFMSLGHEDNKGFNINTGFKRTTLKTNVRASITDNLKTGLSLSYTNREQKGTLTNNITGNFGWVRNIAPIYPVFARDHQTGNLALNSDGNKQWDWADVTSPNATAGRPYSGFSNPHALQTLNTNKRIRDNFTSRVFASYTFLKDLTFTYNLGYDLAYNDRTDYANNIVGSATSPSINGRLRIRNDRATTITNQQLLDWKTNINDVHNIQVLLGHESTNYDFKRSEMNLKDQFLNGDLSPDLFATNDGDTAISGDSREYNLEGYFARVMYDFDGKYFVNGSFRRDGSSVFSPDNRWGNFYGAGAAWLISRESFLSDVSWLNNLKLKTSFGQQGNDIVYNPETDGDGFLVRNYAPYLDQWDVAKNGTGFSLNKTIIGNKDLTWETSTNINVGFEMSMFDNRLNIESEYFIRKISDLISNRELPASTGLPSVPENVLDMENKGVEMAISYQIIKKDNLSLTFGINGTHYKNEITKLPPNKVALDDPNNTRYRWVVGASAFDLYMRKYLGINPDTGNAIWKTDAETELIGGVDTATNGKTENYGTASEYFLGKSSLPDINGGFSLNLEYNNFDFGLNFSYQMGGYAYDAIYSDGFDGAIGRNFSKDYKNTWGWDNKTATLPRIDVDTRNWNQFSDFNVVKSDFLSLNDISIGYSLPKNIIEKMGVSKLRIYANGNNVALWTAAGRDGFDPRQRITGSNNAVRYSTLATYTLGVNINF